MIGGLTLHQLQCFDAVVAAGGFQPAAEKLRRAQPTVFAAVKNLEGQLGLTLLDRSGYRVALTEVGRSFHDRTRVFLQELRGLQNHARQLAVGEERELSVVKKEIIVQGAAWGHLHDCLIERELRDGRLLSIAGRHLRGGRIELTAARRRDLVHGPVANRLWRHIEERAATFTVARSE